MNNYHIKILSIEWLVSNRCKTSRNQELYKQEVHQKSQDENQIERGIRHFELSDQFAKLVYILRIARLLEKNNRDVDGCIEASNLINNIKGPYLNHSKYGVVSNLFYNYEQREICPQQLINRFNADRHPENKILNRSPNDVREEFLSGLSTILTWVQDLKQFQQQGPQYGTPPKSVTHSNLMILQNNRYQLLILKIVQQLNFCPSQVKSVKSYQQKYQQQKEGQSHQSNASQMQSTSRQVELIVQRIRNRLISRGARGVIQFYSVSKILDADHNGMLNLTEFRKAIRDHKIKVTDQEIDLAFQYFDREQTGLLGYGVSFLYEVMKCHIRDLNQQNNYLKNIEQTIITLSTLRNKFIFRKKSDDEIIQGFLNHYNCYIILMENSGMKIHQMKNYQTSLQIIVSALRLLQNGSKHHNAGNKQFFEPDHKRSYLQDHHRYVLQGGSVSANASFGTFTKQEQLAYLRPLIDQQLTNFIQYFKPLEDVKVNQNGSQLQQIPPSQSQISQQSQII
ncbi:unnamed protein product [Paramecium octaurelia]|uniref:EF-hand domain-containing protein n=1 Tax=Paramecium octaurelia TaxID=43137 RepID=A0A8S1UDJ6_PAROT|nr:unnamed protein product [Paramecium octaurelia]